MKVSKNSLVLAAAFTGLLTGTTTRLMADDAPAKKESKKSTEKAVEKHACAGKNSCKGKGGCKTSDNGCKAKNSCKGKGGCATDGSKK
ncbi:MAG TPA: hypothetical protein VNX18_12795 [Bryobacteraceae bacterium]|jgi:hypothetical protein|nr:hypothetical protein [Bryobacteraceae bacterium]